MDSKPQKGTVLIMVLGVMGVVMIAMVFALDAGRFLIISARLQNATDAASDAGAGVLTKVIMEIAQQRTTEYESSYGAAPSSDPLFYLTDEDRHTILTNSVYQLSTFTAMDSLIINNKHPSIADAHFTASYLSTGSGCNNSEVVIASKAELSIPILFKPLKAILNRTAFLAQAKSATSVQLCPH